MTSSEFKKVINQGTHPISSVSMVTVLWKTRIYVDLPIWSCMYIYHLIRQILFPPKRATFSQNVLNMNLAKMFTERAKDRSFALQENVFVSVWCCLDLPFISEALRKRLRFKHDFIANWRLSMSQRKHKVTNNDVTIKRELHGKMNFT